MRPHHRAKSTGTTTKLTNLTRTMTCSTSAFLLTNTFRCTCYFTTRLYFMSTSTTFCKLPYHNALENITTLR